MTGDNSMPETIITTCPDCKRELTVQKGVYSLRTLCDCGSYLKIRQEAGEVSVIVLPDNP